MGGGGAMRAAAKVAGMTVSNSGLRSFPALSPAENPIAAASRKATRPATSTIISSSDELNRGVLTTSSHVNKNPIEAAGVQRPCWELDDWEFAGGEEETVVRYSGEPMPRLVFGGAPTLEEAKEATSQLKDVLQNVYLSPPNSTECGDLYVESGLLLFSTSESPGTSVPKDAIKAFRLLNESSAVQSVVASIASDPKIWDAVLQNEALVEFFHSQKSTAPFSDMDPVMEESAATDAKSLETDSPKSVDDCYDSAPLADSGTGFMDCLHSMKTYVVEMMSSFSDYFQDLFGGPTANADGSARTTFVDGTVAASLMGLAVMVIMVVLLKRV